MVFFGEAEAEQVLTVAGTEERGAGYRCYAGGSQQVAGFFGGGSAWKPGYVGEDIICA
jgi:hypothetical protein